MRPKVAVNVTSQDGEREATKSNSLFGMFAHPSWADLPQPKVVGSKEWNHYQDVFRGWELVIFGRFPFEGSAVVFAVCRLCTIPPNIISHTLAGKFSREGAKGLDQTIECYTAAKGEVLGDAEPLRLGQRRVEDEIPPAALDRRFSVLAPGGL